jgi:hypothetical protein
VEGRGGGLRGGEGGGQETTRGGGSLGGRLGQWMHGLGPCTTPSLALTSRILRYAFC